MADDECDIDELTALLDEESSDFEGVESIEATVSSNLPIQYEDDVDAFLAGSDSESEGSAPVEFSAEDLIVSNSTSKDQDDLFDDDFDSDMLNSFEHEETLVNTDDNVKDSSVGEHRSDTNVDFDNNSKKDLEDELQKMRQKILLLEKMIDSDDKTSDTSPVNTIQQTKDSSKSDKEETFVNQKKKRVREVTENLFFQESSTLTKSTTGSDKQEKSLVHSDNESDWEEDYVTKTDLTTGGKEIEKLLLKQGPRKRTAHTSKPTSELPPGQEKGGDASPKQSFYSGSTSKSSTYTSIASQRESEKQKKLDEEEGVITDPFSKIRIINPLISSYAMKSRMEGRKIIRMSSLPRRAYSVDTEQDWVTVGVIVNKSETRKSTSDKNYCIFKLSDLDDCDHVVSLFLFGECYKAHWKMLVGRVIGILNPSIMKPSDKRNTNEICITIDNASKVMEMGTSKDLGFCKSTTKQGNKCSSHVNKKFGEVCSFHVTSAYKKVANKRTELSGSYTGAKPRGLEKKVLGNAEVYYGGITYSTAKVKPQKKKDKVSLNTLTSHQTHQPRGKVTTLALHDIQPEDKEKLKRLEEKKFTETQNAMHSLLSVPTFGSMNLVKHLIGKEKNDQKETAKKTISSYVESIKPGELLKLHKQEMSKLTKPVNGTQASPAVSPRLNGPVLGKGFQPGQDIFFEDSCKQPVSTQQKLTEKTRQKAKDKATALVKLKGGIEKEDPNAIKKLKTKSSQGSKRKYRATSDNSNKSDLDPPSKKSRLLGNVDIDSEEFKQLRKARSTHTGALKEIENDQQEKYFNELEQKEKYEEKMSSIMEIPCKVFTCKQCKYTFYSMHATCKADNHTVTVGKAMKRFFACKGCKRRTTSIQKYPDKACSGCGGNNFQRTGMWGEKSGPKLESEKLLLRGEERKHINSLQ